MGVDYDELHETLTSTLQALESDDEIEPDMLEYMCNILVDLEPSTLSLDEVTETITPFLESSGYEEDSIEQVCSKIGDLLIGSDGSAGAGDNGASLKVLHKEVSMQDELMKSAADEDMVNALDGKKKAQANANTQRDAFNSVESSKDKRKQKQELEKARKEYEASLLAMEEEEENMAKQGKVAEMILPDYSSGRNERDIQCQNVSISLDNGRCLLDDAELKFSHGRRYGLVGKNGIGKTTLLKAIASFDIHGFPRHHRVLHVRQEIRGSNVSVLDTVLAADVERNTLMEEEKSILARLETEAPVDEGGDNLSNRMEKLKSSIPADDKFAADLKRLDEVYGRLAIIGADNAKTRAATILSGLQFSNDMQNGPTSALSGGWRMRVSLAAALFIEPDLLMLDEPTNHLDLEAVLWLEAYLQTYKHTVVVVSHDRGFLNEVCTDIILFQNQKLEYFKGNYDTYVKTSDDALKNKAKEYDAYVEKRAHIMEFVDKFRYNANRAKLVQSRIKTVEKMDLEAPEKIEVTPPWTFSIPAAEPINRPIIAIDDVFFDYSEEKKMDEALLRKVNFGIDLDSRIGVMGVNGAGKSTLLNLIMGKLSPTMGNISRNGRLRIGYFTQHSGDKFDLKLSAIENMLVAYESSNPSDQEMRSFLGKFEIQGNDALKPMMMLSGGQKSRVAFASLCYQKPHVIVMDEPTNHLDMESIDALVQAVSDFQGGLVVVSHDQFFISKTCSELWVVGNGEAMRFRGTFDDYKKHALEKTSKRVAESVKSLSNING